MVNKSGRIGTAGESAVAKVFVAGGWPDCERRRLSGTFDRGDLSGIPGLVVEVKSGKAAETASDAQIVAWLHDTERERANDNAAYGILVVKRRGVGHDNAARWTAVMWSDAFAHLLSGATFSTHVAFPVRTTLDNVIAALRDAGWGIAA